MTLQKDITWLYFQAEKYFEFLLEGEKHFKIILESSLGDYKVVNNTCCYIAIKCSAVLLKCTKYPGSALSKRSSPRVFRNASIPTRGRALASHVAYCAPRDASWWALECQMSISSSRFMTDCFMSFRAFLKAHSLREAFLDDFIWKCVVVLTPPPPRHCVRLLPFFTLSPQYCHYLTCSAFACLSCWLFQPHLTVGSTRAGILVTTESPVASTVPGTEQVLSIYLLDFYNFSTISIFWSQPVFPETVLASVKIAEILFAFHGGDE